MLPIIPFMAPYPAMLGPYGCGIYKPYRKRSFEDMIRRSYKKRGRFHKRRTVLSQAKIDEDTCPTIRHCMAGPLPGGDRQAYIKYHGYDPCASPGPTSKVANDCNRK